MTFFEVISPIYCRANYYLELMPEKKHQQDADALNLLSALQGSS